MQHLTEVEWQQAAQQLHLPIAVLKAVAAVESCGGGFLPDGRAVILFERHIFCRQLMQHGLDAAVLAQRYPNLVGLIPGGYRGGSAEYRRLAAARQLHAAAADESASWGAFQVMGYHWQALDYDSIEDFVSRMQRSAIDQLEAFIRYLQHWPTLIAALKNQRWTDFAHGYNGPDYAHRDYDGRLARAWAKYQIQVTDSAVL